LLKNNSNKTLILFTQSFPYIKAAEQTFLINEIPYLLHYFSKVIIVPEFAEGEKITVSEDVILDKSLFYYIKHKEKQNKIIKLLLGLHFGLLINELKNRPDIFLSPRKIKRFLSAVYKIRLVKEWFNKHYKESENIIVYTYWFTSTTVGLLNERNKTVTRAHGTDLYEERHNNYIPLRNYALSKIDRVFCVSQAGVAYLTQNYPEYKEKYSLARIGVNNKIRNFQNKKKCGGLRIVSCSGLIPLKRVDLILKGIIEFARRNNDVKIEYIHFGDGQEMGKIKRLINSNNLSNLNLDFKGNTSNSMILNYYADNYVDVFINASTTEGGCPVSIQEAQSFGIPFIGTNVGGIPEIIDKKNGVIISENPSAKEVADAINEIYSLGNEEKILMRENSYSNWQNRFNSELNFKAFAEEISKL